MKRYIAFLRAINVGSHTVRMDELKRLFEALDLANVETFIASGNVIFDSSAKPQVLQRRIETHLAESLGYEVATFLRSTAELSEVAGYQPFGPLDDSSYASLYVSFVGQPVPADAEARILAYRSESDDFHVHGREVYWLCRTKMSDSRFTPGKLEKALGGAPATSRNTTTIKRIAEKYCGGG